MTDADYQDKITQFLTLLMTDMEAAGGMMAEGFVWENFLPDNVPFGGRYEGLDGMKTYFAQLGETWEIGGLDFSEIIVSDDGKRIAAVGVERNGKALATGKSCYMDFVWIFKLDDSGRFTYVREFNDTHTIGQTFV